MSTRGNAFLSSRSRWTLRGITAVVLAFVYVPLAIVVINSFNADPTFSWPPKSFTTEWWRKASDNAGMVDALQTSIKLGLIATAFALVLGTLAAFALTRYAFFGKNTVNLLIILPIALPGIVTGVALKNAFETILG